LVVVAREKRHFTKLYSEINLSFSLFSTWQFPALLGPAAISFPPSCGTSHRVVTPVDEQWLSETTITDYGEEGTQSKAKQKARH
jgi:hypothetical protein